MGFFQQLLAALPAVATSWPALVGYVAVVAAFVVVSLKVTRNKNVLSKLKSVPEADRARVLEMEMGATYLATGLSPEQWLRQQRQRYILIAFLTVCVMTAGLVVAAMLTRTAAGDPKSGRQAAEDIAKTFLARLEAGEFEAAYDLFPEEVRRNIGYAQFKSDMDRLLFQLPGRPLKDSIEQSFQNGPALSVFVTSEFSIDTRIRHIVGFANDANGWKLWQYNWQPVDWPLVWPTSTVIRSSAAETLKVYRTLSHQERASPLPEKLRGTITGSTPGWTLVVNSVTPEQDTHRCTVSATEADSSTMVALKRVVGGCKLSAGNRILVHGMLAGVTDTDIVIEGVRYFPTN